MNSGCTALPPPVPFPGSCSTMRLLYLYQSCSPCFSPLRCQIPAKLEFKITFSSNRLITFSRIHGSEGFGVAAQIFGHAFRTGLHSGFATFPARRADLAVAFMKLQGIHHSQHFIDITA